MNESEARTIHTGDTVRYQGRACRVLSIRTSGVASPLFRLEGVTDGLTSYQLCQLVKAS